jgi:Tol biopolymer transport system component
MRAFNRLRGVTILVVWLLATSACGGSARPTPGQSSVPPLPTSASPLAPTASPSSSPRPGRLVLAFACGRLICMSRPDGAGRRALTGGREADDSDPAWSPDGSQVVFARSEQGGSDLYVVGADGKGLRKVSSVPSADTQPEWSPDGKRIAFTTDRVGNREVEVMSVDGGEPVNLSHNPAEDFGPTWSPDGTRIAYTSTRDGKPEVYVVQADGSKTTRLTISEGSSAPTWSPEGLRVVLVAEGIGLALVDLRAGSVQTITTDRFDGHPRWSPAGDLIAFQRGKSGRTEIYTVKPDGKQVRQVTRDPGADRDPSWGLILI